jgi:hypothetical protein
MLTGSRRQHMLTNMARTAQHLYAAILRHLVLVKAALAICA